MDIQSGPFDPVEAIRYLDRRLSLLENTQPSANMDAAGQGANLAGPYLGPAIPQKIHESIWSAGFDTWEKLRTASREDLLAIPGVGPVTADTIERAVQS